MAAPGAGLRPGASPGLEAALQKLALRRKKVLSAEEMELYELAQAAGGAMDPDVFKILLGLLKLNLAPLAVFQMLKSMCAGQRLPSESQAPAAVSLPTSSAPETREKGETGDPESTEGECLSWGRCEVTEEKLHSVECSLLKFRETICFKKISLQDV
uniref:Mitotic spindle organizing protein 2B n=1 Tax=Equus asinus TaxID=9793 RepID=A0A9L0KBK2_EQUAS